MNNDYDHNLDDCWPPSRCIDPDNCPAVVAYMMEEMGA